MYCFAVLKNTTNITLVTLSMNRLAFCSKKQLKSARPFFTDFKIVHKLTCKPSKTQKYFYLVWVLQSPDVWIGMYRL